MNRADVLTPWIPADTKPVREGFYIVIACDPWMKEGDRELAFWTGKSWAADCGGTYAHVSHWRGLSFNPASPFWVSVDNIPSGRLLVLDSSEILPHGTARARIADA